MPSPPDDARLIPGDKIPALAALYDRFAHAIDPFDPGADEAEKAFEAEVARWHDLLPDKKPSFHDFRRALIVRCKLHLKATSRPPSP